MQTTKSVIISCAGIGSRLGLGTTKALIKIDGKSIIQWQPEDEGLESGSVRIFGGRVLRRRSGGCAKEAGLSEGNRVAPVRLQFDRLAELLLAGRIVRLVDDTPSVQVELMSMA